MFFRKSKSSSATFFTYEDILLKLYIDLTGTGNFSQLIKSGQASDQECLNAWEQIVRKQEKVTGSNQYNSVLQLLKGYASLMNDHTVIRACLVYLKNGPIDWEIIKLLKSKGYSIDTTNRATVLESVRTSLQRNENLVTKATMKKKELERMFQTKAEASERRGFEEILANLNFALGFTVDENITLARYNEYQKILKARAKAAEEAKSKNKNRR